MLMRKIKRSAKRGKMKKVLFALVFSVTVLGMLPNVSGASVITADQAVTQSQDRAQNEAKIKAMLERQEIAARLADYGLTPDEVSSRLDQLSDRQVSEIAAEIDGINAGGDLLGTLLTIALLAILVLVILHLLGYIDLKLPRPKKASEPGE